MKLRPLLVALVLAVATNTISPLSAAVGDEVQGMGHVDAPDEERFIPNLVDTLEPQNNVCEGAEHWPIKSQGISKGSLGPGDAEDWSAVEVYRSESLTAWVHGTTLTLEQASPSCGLPSAVPTKKATQNGWYNLRVPLAADVADADYIVEYEITSNDANTAGLDVGNTPGAAFFVNAMPHATDPDNHLLLLGSLPNRDEPDKDWYRIGTNLAQGADPNGISLGLLTVSFQPGCNGGEYQMTLYQGDGETRITDSISGCGVPLMQSCIAASFSPVYAKLEVPSESRGTGYEFSADLSPLYIVDIDDGVHRTFLDPEQPWCDPLAPLALGLVDENWGIADKAGVVVARVTTFSP